MRTLLQPAAVAEVQARLRQLQPGHERQWGTVTVAQGVAHTSAGVEMALGAVGGASRCTTHPHPFFGRLTPDQWAELMYKHVDHHLRQFGA